MRVRDHSRKDIGPPLGPLGEGRWGGGRSESRLQPVAAGHSRKDIGPPLGPLGEGGLGGCGRSDPGSRRSREAGSV
jgi:hypothetical protein